MNILANFHDDASNAADEERATVCDLRIILANQNICLHLDEEDSTTYEYVTLPAYPLAEGIAYNWWAIFGSRDREYRLIRTRMGYASPDLRLRFDGAEFKAYACQHEYRNPKIRFWEGPSETMSRLEAEQKLDDFVERVIQQLEKHKVRKTNAQLRWHRVRESRHDPEEQAFCEAAGALGADPYRISEGLTDFLQRSDHFFSGEPLVEFLAGVRNQVSGSNALAWIQSSERRPKYKSRMPEVAGLAKQLTETIPAKPNERGWALGYRRARGARNALGLRSGERFTKLGKLTKRLGNSEFEHASAAVNQIRALVASVNDQVHIHLRGRPSTLEARQSEIFAFTRAVGDALCFPGTPRSVVNDLHDADRQAAGRAFAAEFLAPIDEISSMEQDGKDLAAMADDLNVSAEVVQRQLENRDRIHQVCA